MIQPRAPGQRAQLAFRIVAAAALVAALAQVTLGGIVRVTGSGLGCPDWPLCHGRIIPPLEFATLIEYSHRLSASALVLLILAVTALAWGAYRSNHWVLVSSVSSLGLVLVAAALGGLSVATDLAWWVVSLHLGIAEIVVGCLVVALVVGSSTAGGVAHPPKAPARGFNALVLATALGTFALIMWGSYMVGYGAGSSCGTWPLCRGSVIPDGTAYTIHMGHRYMALVVAALVGATAVSAWSHSERTPTMRWAVLILAVLFAGQVLAGAGIIWAGFSSQMKGIHLSLATLVWSATVWLSTLVYYPQRLLIWSDGASHRGVPALEKVAP